MPIDPNIALQVGQPVQPLDPLKSYGQVLTLKHLMDQQRMQGMQMDKAQREEADTQAVRRAYQVTPDGQLDEAGTIRNLVAGGYGPQAVDFRHKMVTDNAARTKAEREAEKAKFEMLGKRIELVGQALGSLPENPTYEQAVEASRWLTSQGIQHDEREIPKDPALLPDYIQQQRTRALSAKEQLEANRPRSPLGQLLADSNKWEQDTRRLLDDRPANIDPSNLGKGGDLQAARVVVDLPPNPYLPAIKMAQGRDPNKPFGFDERGKVVANEGYQKYAKTVAPRTEINNYPPNALEPAKATRTDLEKSLISSSASIARLNDIDAGFRPEFLQAIPRLSAAWSSIKEKGGVNLSAGDRRFLQDFSTWSRSAIEEVNSYIQEKTGAAMGVQEAARLTKGIPNPGSGLVDGDSPSEFRAKLQGVLKQAKLVEARSLYALRNGLTLMGPNQEPVIPLSAMPRIMDERGAELERELRRQNPKISPKEMRTQVLQQLGREFGITAD